MEKIFEIKSGVTAEILRRGMTRTSLKMPHYFIIVFGSVWCLSYVRDLLFYRMTFEMTVVAVAFIVLVVFCIFKLINSPKKQAELEINQLISVTGVPYFEQTYEFYPNEITWVSLRTGKYVHMPYYYIKRIYEFSDFIMLSTDVGKAVYIAKKDIADLNYLKNFMSGVCPDLKYKKK